MVRAAGGAHHWQALTRTCAPRRAGWRSGGCRRVCLWDVCAGLRVRRLEQIIKESGQEARGEQIDDVHNVVHLGDPTPSDPYGIIFVGSK